MGRTRGVALGDAGGAASREGDATGLEGREDNAGPLFANFGNTADPPFSLS